MNLKPNATGTDCRAILDAIPLIILVVDEDVQIQDMNLFAAQAFGPNAVQALQKRGGEAFGCIHSTEAPGGCGRGAFCKQCVIRDSVNVAFQGNKVSRRRTHMHLTKNGSTQEIEMLITANPFEMSDCKRVLLILEDISELSLLKSIIPICASCKRVRETDSYWENMEKYFHNYVGVDFSHGLCLDCARKLYPDLAAHMGK